MSKERNLKADQRAWSITGNINKSKTDWEIEANFKAGWNAALESEAVKNLVSAIDNATDLICSEYCSHAGPCGDIEKCYARKQFKALAEFEEAKGD